MMMSVVPRQVCAVTMHPPTFSPSLPPTFFFYESRPPLTLDSVTDLTSSTQSGLYTSSSYATLLPGPCCSSILRTYTPGGQGGREGGREGGTRGWRG